MGSGLSISGNTLNNSGVTSVQGQSGAVTFTAGGGIAINGLNISNTGVTSLNGTANQISVSQSTGGVTLSLPQDIAQSSAPTFASVSVNDLVVRSGGFTGTINFAGATANRTISLPDENGTICLQNSAACGFLTPGTAFQQGGNAFGALGVLGTTDNNALSVITNNTERLRITSTGTVQVTNALTVGSTLQVTGAGSFLNTLAVTGDFSVNTNMFTINSSNGDTYIAGNLGIGTAGPGYKLDVVGDINATGIFRVGGAQISSANLSNDANLAKLNGAQTFTGANTFSNAGNSFTGNGSGLTSLNASNVSSGTLGISFGGTGLVATPLSGQLLIGNGSGYTLNTLTAGPGITITNSAGGITIESPTAGSCTNCAQDDLSNLSNVAINTSLLTGSATIDLGSATNPFRDLYLGGTTTNNFQITGTATAPRVISLPDADGTVCLQSSTACGFASSSNAILNGGNSFGGDITIGTNDSNNLSFETAGVEKVRITTAGDVGIGQPLGPGYKLDVNGDINTTGIYRVGGAQITSANLANDSALAKLTAASQTFTGVNTFSNSVAITGASGLTLGSVSNLGTITFRDGSTANTASLALAGALGGNAAFVLPQVTGTHTICTVQSGNCAGSGGGVTGSGTLNRLAKFTSTGSSIGDSSISDDGTTVTVSTGAIIQGNAGLTLGASGVNGQLIFKNSTNSNTITLQSGITTGNLALTLPTADGNANDCLKTDGSGALAFASCTGGPGGGVTSVNTLSGIINIVGTSNQINVGAGGSTITLSLPQDIATTSNVGFRTIALNGTAAGDNMIVANAVSGATGNLLDLKVNGVSKFTVDANGDVVVGGTYNGQSITVTGITSTGNINSTGGALQTNSVTRIDNSGNATLGTALFKNGSNSTTAFQIQNAAGSTVVLNADTTNGRIGIGNSAPGYPLDVTGDINTSGVYRINGTAICTASGCTAAAGSSNYIQNGTTPQTANFNITGNGTIGGNLAVTGTGSFGNAGITIGDTNLYRSATDVLKTDDAFEVAGSNINVSGSTGSILLRGKASTSTPILLARVSGDTSDRFEMRADGALIWGSGSASGDTNLYRSTANTLTTDDRFSVSRQSNGDIWFQGSIAGQAQEQFRIDSSSNGPVLQFGGGALAVDTNLYRGAANQLKTDDSFYAVGGLRTDGLFNATGTAQFNGVVSFLNSVNSVTAVQIQNAAASVTVFNADTVNGRVGIGNAAPSYPLDVTGDINTSGVYRINGTTICSSSGCTAASGSTHYIQNGTSPQTANFNITGNGTIGGNLAVTGTGTFSGIVNANATGKTAISIADSGAQSSGLTIGGDTNLYRSAANTLATDDSLSVGSNLTVVGSTETTGQLNTPFGGYGRYQNLLVRSEEFSNASWSTTNATVTANTHAAPDGQTTADTLATTSAGGIVGQTTSTAVGGQVTFSVWVRSTSGTQSFSLRIDSTGSTGNITNHTATTTWQRFTHTEDTSAMSGNLRPRIWPGGGGGTGSVVAWGAQLEQATTAGVYLATTGTTQTSTSYGATINGSAQITGPALFRNNADSTSALQIQNSAGTSNLFVADTTNTRIGIGQSSPLARLHIAADDSGQDVLIGDNVATAANSDNILTVGNTDGDSRLRVGQSNTGFAAFSWIYNATEASAYAHLSTNSSANALILQNSGGSVGIGATTTPTSRLSVAGTGSSNGITLGYDAANSVNLYRSAADTLKTDDNLVVVGDITADDATIAGTLTGAFIQGIRSSASLRAFAASVTGDSNDRFQILSDGSIKWGAGGGTAVDTTLSRSAGNELTLSGDLIIQGGDLTTNQTTFNLINTTATTLNVGGAASTLNIGPGSSTATSINLAGGSGATGCTVDGATGNLTCSGNISGGSTGTQGYWSRSGTTLQPATAGDSITTSGNISTTSSGAITAAGILSANATGKTAIQIADSGAQSSGITIGGDTNLYRGGSDLLKTDDQLRVERASSTDIAFSSLATGNANAAFQIQAGGQIRWGDGTSNIDTTLSRSGAAELTANGDLVLQGGDLITNQTTASLFNTTATTLNIGGVASTLNIGPGSSTATSINLAGGSGATGCTVDGATGNLTCSGNITGGSTGTQGYWTRSGTTLQPATSGDSVYVNANSTSAFKVERSGVNNNTLVVDTTNGFVGVGVAPTTYKLEVLAANSGLHLYSGATNQFTFLGLGRAALEATIGQVGASGQFFTDSAAGDTVVRNTAGRLMLGTGSGTAPVVINANGSASFKNTTNSTTAFQIQNSTGGNLLQVDSTNSNITLNGLNSGEPQPWSTESDTIPTAAMGNSVIAANGYLYSLGGAPTSAGTVTNGIYYAKLNADGSTGSWTNQGSNLLNTTVGNAASTTANGFVYLLGGRSDNLGGTRTAVVQYARLNPDGSTGAWSTTTSLPAALSTGTAQVYNGYIYLMGGDTAGSGVDTVYFARLNADGTVGTWSTTTVLPATTQNARSAIANGYMYVLGNSSSNVYYGKINTDGTIPSWSTGTAMPANRVRPVVGIANGYIYAAGGSNNKTVYYAALANNGSIGAWSSAASANQMPNNTSVADGAIVNGYIYNVGGSTDTTNAITTVVYSSTPRLKVGGSLDLVGLSGGVLTEGGAGGTLTAGNTDIIGNLSVRGSANIEQNLNVTGDTVLGSSSSNSISVKGTISSTVLVKPTSTTTESTSQFQIQRALGALLFTVDSTSNASISIGNAVPVSDAKLLITSGTSTNIRANNTGSGTLLELQKSGTNLFTVGNTGAVLAQNTTNSTSAFRIQNSAATTTLFSVDTTNTKVTVTGTLANIGGGNFASLSTPAQPTVVNVGTAGSTSYSYAVSALNANGGETPISTAQTTATGNATLTGSNFNRISWSAVAGAKEYRIYRTASSGTPATTGLIGTVQHGSTLQFDDTAVAGGGGTGNTLDSSGNVGIGTSTPGNLLSVGALTTADTAARVAVGTGATTNKGIVVQGVASQSADLLQAQSSTGAVLAKIDASGNLTVKSATFDGTDAAFVTVTINNAHFKSTQTTAPTIGTPSTCGTSPTASVTTGSTDSAGSITINAGTGSPGQCAVIVTFRTAYGAAPKSIVLTPKSQKAAANQSAYISASSTTTFTITLDTAPGASDSLQYNYWVVE